MIVQDELVDAALAKAGQFIVLPSDILLDDPKIAILLSKVVGEYTRYRPVSKHLDVDIGTLGFTPPPDFVFLVNLRRRGLTITDIGAGIFYRRTPADYFTVTGGPYPVQQMIQAIPGLYRLEYGAVYTTTFIVPSERVYAAIGTETRAVFKLRGKVRPGTVTLTRNAVSVTDNGAGFFVGGFITGASTINYNTGDVNLVIAAAADEITGTYMTVNPGILELSMYDEFFIAMWETQFLHALADGKTFMRIDGTPFDLNQDSLLDYIRGRETYVNERYNTDKKWFMW